MDEHIRVNGLVSHGAFPRTHTVCTHERVGITGLEREDASDDASKKYAIYLADTVVVTSGGAAPEVATGVTAKEWKDVAYYLKVSRVERAFLSRHVRL